MSLHRGKLLRRDGRELVHMPGYDRLGGDDARRAQHRRGKTDLAKRYGNICIVMGAGFMAITGLLMMFLCPFVFSILTPDLSVRALAAQALRIGLLAEPLYGVSIVAAGALRGNRRYLRAEYDEPRQYLGGAHRACTVARRQFRSAGMWTAMGTELWCAAF